jgi:hypothetical protein
MMSCGKMIMKKTLLLVMKVLTVTTELNGVFETFSTIKLLPSTLYSLVTGKVPLNKLPTIQ